MGGSLAKHRSKSVRGASRFPRLRTWQLVLMVLVAGWVPSVLMAFLSYAYLSDAFEERIQVNELNVVRTMARLVEADLGHIAEVMEYFETLPRTREMAREQPGAALQEWLSSIYYSHPRIDGMFLTDAAGRTLASLPYDPGMVGESALAQVWLPESAKSEGAYVSPVFPREPDHRMNAVVVVAIRESNGDIIGYLGASVLVERIGRRMNAIGIAKGGTTQIIDQNGFPLFDSSFSPSAYLSPIANPGLVARFHQSASGIFELDGHLYTFSELHPSMWVVVFAQPTADAYGPVHELVARITLLAGWLVVGTALVATSVARLYRRQLENSVGIERAMLLNENILANIPVGIAQLDPVRRAIVQANDEFVEIATACRTISLDENVIGLTIRDFPFVTEEVFDEAVRSGRSFSAREQRFVAEDGRQHFHAINVIRLQDKLCRPQGVLLIVEDQTRDVALRRQLIEANTAKDQFLAVLSHELRNPLSPVITMVAELEDTHGAEPETRRALEVIRRNVELEARLIDDLLDITRITNRKLQLHREVTDVHEALRRSIEICQRDVAEKLLVLEARLDATACYVNGDPARLQQVFWNLIKNAIKFSPDQKRVYVTTANPVAGRVVISIRDEGIGIAPDRIDRIFRAFEQGEMSITRRFGGLGLGLAISRAMVEAHGGILTAASAGIGKGATFTVTLNTVKQALATSEPTPARDGALELRGLRILLVDDHEDTSRGLSRLLTRRGMVVTVAACASEALAAAEQERFDLVVSDLGLPDKSGHELMRELKVKYALSGVALSGFGMEGDLQRSLESGFAVHLTKPVNIAQLEKALKTALSGDRN